ncbi:MAG: hypothetical protein CMI54_02085 [Parcubacteria group bacterium]|nr:hypothetical protein [Parcubacteria group bacterium]
MAWTLGYTAADFTKFTDLGQYVNEITAAYIERYRALNNGTPSTNYQTKFGDLNDSSNSNSNFMHEIYDDINDLISGGSEGHYVNYTNNSGNWEIGFAPSESNFAPVWTEAELLTKTGWASRIVPTDFTKFTSDKTVDFIRQCHDFLNELIWTRKRLEPATPFQQLDKDETSVISWADVVTKFNAATFSGIGSGFPDNIFHNAQIDGTFAVNKIERRAVQGGLEVSAMNFDSLNYDFQYYAGFEVSNTANPAFVYQNNDFPGTVENQYKIIESGTSSSSDFNRTTGEINNNSMNEPPDGVVFSWAIKESGDAYYLHLIQKYDVSGGFVYV